MWSTLFLVLLLFIAAINSGPLPSNEADELAQDGGSGALEVAEEHGNNGVKLVRPGYVELVISGEYLTVDVNPNGCYGTVLFCYAAKTDKINGAAKDLCSAWPGFCGFQVIGTPNDIKFAAFTYTRDQLVSCKPVEMKFSTAEYCKDVSDASCDAAIPQEGSRIGIHVIHADDKNCPVYIKNAKIYIPPTTPVPSTAPPSMSPLTNDTIIKNEDKAAEASAWPWIVLGVGIALILIGIFIGIFLCWFNDWCMFKKKTADTLPPPRPVEEIVATTVEAKTEEKIEKAYEKIKAEHPELKEVISKKSKKALSAPPPPRAEPSKNLPPPPSAEPVKKLSPPPCAKSAKKAKTPPPTVAAAPSKKDAKEKKPAPASPGKKIVEKKVAAPSAEKKVSKEGTTTEAYSPPFCLLPVRAPTPPVNPNDPNNVNINRKPGQKGHLKNSLELPSYSGGRPVPPSESIQQEMKKNAAAEAAREAEKRKMERMERNKRSKK